MQILKAIHDELVSLRARLHDLVEPEKTIADKVHAWIDEAMTTLHAFEARVVALEDRVKAAEAALVGSSPVAPHPQPRVIPAQPVEDAAPSSSEPVAT